MSAVEEERMTESSAYALTSFSTGPHVIYEEVQSDLESQGQQQSPNAYEEVSIVLKSQEQEQFLDVKMKPSSPGFWY